MKNLKAEGRDRPAFGQSAEQDVNRSDYPKMGD
jgi:hypothetical protein